MRIRRAWFGSLLAAGLALGSMGSGPCEELERLRPGTARGAAASDADGAAWVRFVAPARGQLSEAGPLELELELRGAARRGELTVFVDGAPLDPALLHRDGSTVHGELPELGAGRHDLGVDVTLPRGSGKRAKAAKGKHSRHLRTRAVSARSWFELVALERPDVCEILNSVECVLPFPSSRFLERADTATGWRVKYPEGSLPPFNRLDGSGFRPLDASIFLGNDGFSPTTQILMHFPAGVDPELSDAPRLLEATRSFDARSLDRDSPTVLVDLDTGERVLHFIENDGRAVDPERVVTYLRVGESLRPGHRYAVAARRLKDPNDFPVEAEPVFAAIRDRRPSDIPAVQAARKRLEPVLERLERFRIRREELLLAFDFVVQSDASLAGDMLSMRDQAFAWLADASASPGPGFEVVEVLERNPGCADPQQPVWREIRGFFDVPLFLDSDPYAGGSYDAAEREFAFPGTGTLGFLRRGADGAPAPDGVTRAPFGIAVPCAVFDGSGGVRPRPALVIGHGLFGTGPDTVSELAQAEQLDDFAFVAGGTNWAGLSGPDIEGTNGVFGSFVLNVFSNLDHFAALPDRLRQGQLDTLVLARLLRTGAFNAHPAFQDAAGSGVIAADGDAYFLGASLGGIMGIMFAALTPDVLRHNVDVPAINFGFLLERATPFLQFELLLTLLNPDRMQQALGISLLHELWVRGESAGYATHVTRDPLPGSRAKRVLMTVALHDQAVSNLGSQLAARTLRLPNLRGSALDGLPGIPDRAGPLRSALVIYDSGAFDPANPAHEPFIPPLTNRQAQPNHCDPHGRRGFTPASVEQLLGFLTPQGRVENFCSDDGICNASEPFEIPFGDAVPCDPLAP